MFNLWSPFFFFFGLGMYGFTLIGKQIIQTITLDTIGVLTKTVCLQIRYKHDFAVKESEGNKIHTQTHTHKISSTKFSILKLICIFSVLIMSLGVFIHMVKF